MSNDIDFFGDVFGDPSDDPLLKEEAGPVDESPGRPESAGRPSWMSEEEDRGGREASPSADRTGACQKEIVVDPRRDDADGLDVLNRAVGNGWQLVRLSLDRPDGEQAASRRAAHRFVAVLEKERAQSLFDFG